MVERRKIDRVTYGADSVMVVREDLSKVYGKVKNLSPLGMAVSVKADTPSLLGKDVIIVADTLIMYADVIREDSAEDGTKTTQIEEEYANGQVTSKVKKAGEFDNEGFLKNGRFTGYNNEGIVCFEKIGKFAKNGNLTQGSHVICNDKGKIIEEWMGEFSDNYTLLNGDHIFYKYKGNIVKGCKIEK